MKMGSVRVARSGGVERGPSRGGSRTMSTGAFLFFLLALPEFLLSMPARADALTLDEAVDRALQANPRLRAAVDRIRGAEGERRQAGRLPNPELSAEIEDVGGDLDGFEERETTVRLRQRLELGGERGSRIRAARHEEIRFREALTAARLELVAEVTQSFHLALLARDRLRLAGEALELARSLHSTVRAQVAAGNVSPIEETRASIEAANAGIALEEARIVERNAVRALAGLWGGSGEDVVPEGEVPVSIGSPNDPDSTRMASSRPGPILSDLDSLRALVESAPRAREAEAHALARESLVGVERGERFPDLELGLGLRHRARLDDRSYVLELGLPLPLFDRGGGSVAAALAEASAARQEALAVEASLLTRLASAREALRSAAARLESVDREVIGAAREVYDAVRRGYDAGKFGYLDLLEAQRALIAARAQRLLILERLVEARAEIQAITGGQ